MDLLEGFHIIKRRGGVWTCKEMGVLTFGYVLNGSLDLPVS